MTEQQISTNVEVAPKKFSGLVNFIIFVSIVFVMSIPYLLISIENKLQPLLNPDRDSVSEISEETPISEIPEISGVKESYVKLLRNGEKVVTLNTSYYYIPPIIVYKDNLIFRDVTTQQILLHSTTSGETKTLYINEQLNQFPPKGETWGKFSSDTKNYSEFVDLSFIEVIDGVLYFSYGGYLLPGVLLKVDLNSSSFESQLVGGNLESPTIVKLDETLFLRQGFGDGCGSISKYRLYDSANNKLQETEVVFESSCVEGKYFVGYNSDRNEFLYISYTRNHGNDVYTGLYTLDSTGAATSLLTVSDFANISGLNSFKYDYAGKKVYFTSSEEGVWDYSRETDQLEFIGELRKEIEGSYIDSFVGSNGICILSGSASSLIDKVTGKILTQNPEECTFEDENTIITANYLTKLQLPPAYIFELSTE